MRCFFALVLVLFTLSLSAQDFELTSINLTVENGLVGDNVYCALQDDKGYIWFGTETGVSRYNGKSFENFYITDGLGDNEVFRIDQDTQGRIWFSSFNGQLSYYKEGTFYNATNDTTLAKVVMNNYYISLFEDSKQNIWLASKIHLVKIGREGEVINFSENPLNQKVRIGSFIEKNGEVWGKAIANNTTYNLSHAAQHKDRLISVIGTADEAEFISGNSSYLMISNQNGDKDYIKRLSNKDISRLKDFSKMHVYKDSDVWVCTFGGALRLNKKTGDSRLFLPGKQITHVLKDRENGYWFTTLGDGVYFVTSLDNRSISKINNVPIGNVLTVVDLDNEIWIGANLARFGQIKDEKIDINSLYLSNGRSRTKKIMKGRDDGDLLIVLEEGLLLKRANGTFSRMPGSIKTINKWTNQLYAMGITWGLVVIDIDKLYEEFDEIGPKTVFKNWRYSDRAFAVKSFKFGSVLDIEPHGNGMLIASARGLYFLNDELELSKVNGHPAMNSVINDIISINDSTYVLASGGYGLLLASGDSLTNITTEDGLSSNIIKRVFIEDRSVYWLATNSGIDRLDLGNDEQLISSIKSMDGLISEDVNDLIIKEGELWAATSKGISKISLTDWESPKLVPKLNMRSMIVDDLLIMSMAPLTPNVKNIKFEFDGLHFQSLNRLTYKYRLEGFDNTWRKTDQNTVDFNGLRSGNYNFEVKAISAFGDESEVSNRRFTIATPFWATSWFITLSIIAFSISLFLLIQFVVRRNKIKEKRKFDIQLKIAEAERKALQSQLNPHFIFNSLNSIQNMVLDNNTEGVYQYLAKFGKLIRRVLEFSDISMVSLAEELETLRLYMELENLRLNNKFDFEVIVSPEVDLQTKVPSMLIQPYVENAIWHGITPLKNKRRGLVTIRVKNTLKGLGLEVVDNGVGRESERNKKEEGLGTRIVNELVRKHKGEHSGEVEILDLYEKGQSIGTKVKVQLLPQLSI
ncbi:histidine kinase [Roseivirga sp.]|uniref:sensor histidine kinase n=1 Tax=Roseivirga sp. TaxID=1964215 RepID=UPI003B8B55E0